MLLTTHILVLLLLKGLPLTRGIFSCGSQTQTSLVTKTIARNSNLYLLETSNLKVEFMKKPGMSEFPSAPNLLRVKFSDAITSDTLQMLHTTGLTDKVPHNIRELIHAAGGERISSVYQLSLEEINHDKYGFACEFKLYLQDKTDVNAAIETLRRSPLVKSVKAVRFQQSL